MADINSYKTNPKYPDSYDYKEGWVKILPRPGRPLQTRELIELQSIHQESFKRAIEPLTPSGSILKGLDITIISEDENTLRLGLSEGDFFVEGRSVFVPSRSNIEVTRKGEYSIGVRVDELILTELDDKDLRDPLMGGSEYGLAGASRLVWQASITLNDPSAFPIYHILDGLIRKVNYNLDESIENLIADYIYDREGNFLIEGLEVKHNRTEDKTNNLTNRELSPIEVSLSEDIEVVSNLQIEEENLIFQRRDLNTRLEELREQSLDNPSPSIFSLIQDLQGDLNSLEEQINVVESSLSEAQLRLSSELVRLASVSESSDEAIIEHFIVSPGIAYIKGRRTEYTYPQYISIPKSNIKGTVKGASFLYKENVSLEFNKLILGSNFNTLNQIAQVDNSINLSIHIEPYIYKSSLYKVIINIHPFDIPDTQPITLLSLLTHIKEALNSYNSQHNLDYINFKIINNSDEEVDIASDPDILVNFLNQVHFEVSSYNNLVIINSLNYLLKVQFESSQNELLYWESNIINIPALLDTKTYVLGQNPIHNVNSLIAELKVKDKLIVKSDKAQVDYLGDNSIVNTLKVYQGNNVYREHLDYELIDQSSILWLDRQDSLQPNPGTTYFVDFIHTEELIEEEDYQLNYETGEIKFTSGRKPSNGYKFYVNYDFVLPEVATIYIDRTGKLSFIKSEASTNPRVPKLEKENLKLADIFFIGDEIRIEPSLVYKLSTEQLNNILNRLKSLEFRLRSLENLITLYENDIEPSKHNLASINNLSEVDLAKSNISILPIIDTFGPSEGHKELLLSSKSRDNLLLYLRGSNRTIVDFNASTSAIEIPVLRDFNNITIGNLILEPRVVYAQDTESYVVTTYNPSQENILALSKSVIASPLLEELKSNIEFNYGDIVDLYSRQVKSEREVIQNLENLDREETVTLGKEIEIYFKVEGLRSFQGGISLLIDNQLLDVSRLIKGNRIGNNIVQATSQGEIEGYIYLPSSLSLGIKNLIVRGDRLICSNKLVIRNPIKDQLIEEILNLWRAESYSVYDPNYIYLPGSITNSLNTSSNLIRTQLDKKGSTILQTFTSKDWQSLVQVDLAFRTVNEEDSSVYIEIAEYINIDSPKVIYRGVIDNIIPSITGTNLTRHELTKPVTLKPDTKYLIGLRSNKGGFSLFYAREGERFINANRIFNTADLLNQDGSLYQSFDGINYQLIPRSRLNMRLHGLDVFNNESSAIYDLGTFGLEDNITNISHFAINSLNSNPTFTDIVYEYKAEGEWYPFKANEVVQLSNRISKLSLRAKIKTFNSRITPVLDKRYISVSLYSSNKTYSIYLKPQVFSSVFNSVSVKVNVISVEGSYINVQLLDLETQTWKDLSETSSELLDSFLSLEQKLFNISQLNPTHQLILRLNISSNEETSKVALIKGVNSYVNNS